jgi:hypothetical protein
MDPRGLAILRLDPGWFHERMTHHAEDITTTMDDPLVLVTGATGKTAAGAGAGGSAR